VLCSRCGRLGRGPAPKHWPALSPPARRGIGRYGLRTAPVAPPQWSAENPRVFFVFARTPAPRLVAGPAGAPAQAACSARQTDLGSRPCPGPARRSPVLLSANHAATDPKRCRSPPLPAISGSLSSLGLPPSPRSPPPLLVSFSAPATATPGRLVFRQRRLAPGAAQSLQRLVSGGLPAEPATGRQSEPFSDP